MRKNVKDSSLKLLRDLLSLPTAPFHEHEIITYIEKWAERKKIRVTQDRTGNVILKYKRGKSLKNKWVFHAHMDHPGFVTLEQKGRIVRAQFLGGVRREYFKNAFVRFFTPDGEITGKIKRTYRLKGHEFLRCEVRLSRTVCVPDGTIGMWNFPAWKRKGNRLFARSCDDVAGTAVALAAIELLHAAKAKTDLTVLLTRAEEIGFVSGQDSCKAGTIPEKSLLIGIEASRAQPSAMPGDGAVIRVGDSLRNFDPSLTMFITGIAGKLAKRKKSFKYVRSLMPGGSTETTGFMMFGCTAAAICLPLLNYHNMNENGRLAPEGIDLNDFQNAVNLLCETAQSGRTPRDADRLLKLEYQKRLKAMKPLLRRKPRR